MSKFEPIYQLVRKIPKGKVTTYGTIAKQLGMSPRVVGYALHMNQDGHRTPCHRVVDRNGRIALGYAFGGAGIQKKLLEKEGIVFKDLAHLNLDGYIFGY